MRTILIAVMVLCACGPQEEASTPDETAAAQQAARGEKVCITFPCDRERERERENIDPNLICIDQAGARDRCCRSSTGVVVACSTLDR